MIHSATRRMYRRISTDYPACYMLSSSLQYGVVRDLSLNGFRIEGSSRFSRNAIVMLRLWLPNDEGSIDIDQAVVRWANADEFAVQIIALSNEADLRLALHVERTLERKPIDRVAC